MEPTLVIGVGNANRGDDAAGLVIAERLMVLAPESVRVLRHSGESVSLLEAWEGFESVLLIDAVISGSPPGTVHRLNALTGPLPECFFPKLSSHGIGVAEAIELARNLNRLPSRFLVFGVEGRSFEPGRDLSPEVNAAANKLLEEILKLLR